MTVNVTPLNDAPKVIDNNGTPDDASDDVESVASLSTVEDVDRSIGINDLTCCYCVSSVNCPAAKN